MKDETARKRIISAIRKEPLIDNEKKFNKMFNRIWSNYQELEREEPEYTSTENLAWAISFNLYDGEEYIRKIIGD